jgi:hypothetical protein
VAALVRLLPKHRDLAELVAVVLGLKKTPLEPLEL